MNTNSCIEPLEARIAPAVMILTNHTASYLDVDGDKVTVTVSKGDLHGAGIFTTVSKGLGEQLQKIDLSAGGFDGADLTVSVAKAATGDGLAAVGHLNSTGHDLGKVTVKGDLGQINAGSGSATIAALKSLGVSSLGRYGLDTQAAGGSLESNVNGALGALKVAGDVANAQVVTSGASGRIGAVTIGGSLLGTDGGFHSGLIWAKNAGIGLVKIAGNVEGGPGEGSGQVVAAGKLAGAFVGGSLLGGDGAAYTGAIASDGDMGPVTIRGNVVGGAGADSGRIQCLGKLTSVTIGGSLRGGAGTQNLDSRAPGQIHSTGDMGAVTIRGDVVGGAGADSGRIQSLGKLTSVSIGGSLIGGSASESGSILSRGDMVSVKIGGDVVGGSGASSAFIESHGKLTSVSIRGSLIDGSGLASGWIQGFGDIGSVKIGHDVRGLIGTFGKLASVSVGGSLIGGSKDATGAIGSAGDLGVVKIGHNLIGGSIAGTASLSNSGIITSDLGRIASVTIGGSIISGVDASSGVLSRNATVFAENDIGSLTVKGSLIGNITPDGASPVIISARGQAVVPVGATTDLAIGKISIGGRVEFANLLAGYDVSLSAVNGDAQIGAVKVAGDWVASNLVAGAINLGTDQAVGGSGLSADNINYGDSHDLPILLNNKAGIVAKIASITIGGKVVGTPSGWSATDHFGFSAQQIGSFKAGASTAHLTSVKDAPIELSPITGDVTVREVA